MYLYCIYVFISHKTIYIGIEILNQNQLQTKLISYGANKIIFTLYWHFQNFNKDIKLLMKILWLYQLNWDNVVCI